MIFVSNDKVDEVFEKLMNEEFRIADYNALNNQLFSDCGNSKDKKVKYGYISKYIKDMNPDKRDLLYKNADFCIKVTESNECNDILMQVINHIILEVPRANDFDQMGEQTKRYSQQIRDFRQIQRDFNSKIEFSKTEFNNIKVEFNRFENRIGNIQNEFIGILSIFSAIIIAFFGGTQVLGQVISNIKSSNFYTLTMITIVIGMILFNIIYMLLYTVSKIISKNIGINISKCKNCSNDNRFRCLISKYPIVFWYNSVSILGIIITFIVYNLDRYLALEFLITNLTWLISHKKFGTLTSRFVIILISIFVLKAIFKKVLKKFNFKLPNVICSPQTYKENSEQNCSDYETKNPEFAVSKEPDGDI